MVLRRFASLLVLALLLAGLSAVPALAADAVVDISGFDYDPEVVSIDPGESVTWTNNHFEPHTVTADDGSYDYWVNPGESVTHTYTEEGYEPYFCVLHGEPGFGMTGAVLVGDAEAPPPPDVTPLQATDNIGSAIAWSQRNFGDGAQTALIGRDDLFADSLTSGWVQGTVSAPLLLTPSDDLDDRTRDELRRLDVSDVIIFGGTAAVGPEVADALRDEGYELTRVRGSNRVGTAVNAAERLFGDAQSVILARGFGDPSDPTRAFADSLAAGALGAMTEQPILLTTTDALSPETREYLAASPVEQVFIVGGVAAVSAAVESELEAMGLMVERLSGPNRFATAVQTIPVSGPRPVLTLIDGSSANAWAAGFPAASAGYPVILAHGDTLPDETIDVLVMFGGDAQALCGPFLASAVCARAQDAASAVGFFGRGAKPFILEGRQETAGGNDAASGLGGVYPTSNPSTICYEYSLLGGELGELTGAHIHHAARGADGPVVVPLSTNLAAAAFGTLHGCAFDQDPALVSAILENHSDYYVNLHTTEYPAGAIRGQLFDLTWVLPAELSGDQEPAGGDPEAGGFGIVAFPDYPGEVCVLIFLGVSTPTTAAHIHEGPAGEDGPPVLTLRTPPQFGGDAGCYPVGESLLNDLRENPAEYYLNVHTEAHPGGAIRGQLG